MKQSSVLSGFALVLALICGAWAPAARASMVKALDMASLVEQADVITIAKVAAQHAHYDARGRIVTDVELIVESSEKGALTAGSSIIVRRLGGVVGKIGMRIEGEPSFADGELVLLFGKRSEGEDKDALRPLGMAQGVLRIREIAAERWVEDGSAGLALVREVEGGKLEKARAMLPEPRRLDDVVREIRALLKARK